MAKSVPGSYSEIDPDEISSVGSVVLEDGGGGWNDLNANHNWLLANRVRAHVQGAWPIGNGVRAIFETNAAFVTRLEYRIVPRLHVARVKIWCNGHGAGGGPATGEIRVSIGGSTTTFTFTGNAIGTTWQSTTLLVTGGTPPATDLLTVDLRITTGASINLTGLWIADDVMVLGDMP